MQTNGTTQYAYVDNPTFKSNTQGALSFWSFPTSILTSEGLDALISYGDTSGSNNSLLLISQRWSVLAGSYPRPDILTRTTNDGANNTGIAAYTVTSAWRHNVIQTNGTTWQWYINGVLQTTNSWLGTNTGDWFGDISGTNHRLVFGANYRAGVIPAYGANKQLQAIYFNAPLTAGEVTALYNGGTPRTLRGMTFGATPISWWEFGGRADTGSTVRDRIGTNHLTVVGSPTYVSP